MSSMRLRSARPSPSAMAISAARASGVSGRGWPSAASARSASSSSAASSSRFSTSTRARESSAELSSKEGFSVVAPTSTMVPSSISGRKASCWARLKRWISSTKSRVPRPFERRRRAASKIFLRSATPVKMALIWTKVRLGGVGEQPGDGGLADAGRAPEDDRAEAALGQHPPERAVGAEQVVLADDLVEAARAAAGRRAGAGRRRRPEARGRRDGGRRGRPWRQPTGDRGDEKPPDRANRTGADAGVSS